VAAHLNAFVQQLRLSSVTYHYFISKEGIAKRRRTEGALRKRSSKKEDLPNRVRFHVVPDNLVENIPVFADLLLLKGAVIDWADGPRNYGIVGAPPHTVDRPEDKQDMLVSDPRGVQSLETFFRVLENEAEHR
jgi:hypothetical protein